MASKIALETLHIRVVRSDQCPATRLEVMAARNKGMMAGDPVAWHWTSRPYSNFHLMLTKLLDFASDNTCKLSSDA
jgi:hypothetical protein